MNVLYLGPEESDHYHTVFAVAILYRDINFVNTDNADIVGKTGYKMDYDSLIFFDVSEGIMEHYEGNWDMFDLRRWLDKCMTPPVLKFSERAFRMAFAENRNSMIVVTNGYNEYYEAGEAMKKLSEKIGTEHILFILVEINDSYAHHLQSIIGRFDIQATPFAVIVDKTLAKYQNPNKGISYEDLYGFF